MINLAFIGQLNNPLLLSGVGLGNCIQNMFGTSIGNGFCNAFGTLSAQAKGSGNMKHIGLYLNRARLILLMLFTVTYLLLRKTDTFLIYIG